MPLILWYKQFYEDLPTPQKEHAMGERIAQPAFDFNRSVRLEIRPERVTSDAGALLIREALHKLGIDHWLSRHLTDLRRDDMITHPWIEPHLSKITF